MKDRLTPRLVSTHPGYAIVTLVMTAVHIAAWSDGVLGGKTRHAAPVFRVFDDLGGVAMWGWLHAAVALVMIAGLYRSFELVHSGFLFSVGLYTSTAVAYAESAINDPRASWLGACYAAAFAAISWAGMKEPPVNPVTAKVGRE